MKLKENSLCYIPELDGGLPANDTSPTTKRIRPTVSRQQAVAARRTKL
ncbi:hypothetical protein [Paraburkholderia sp. USG1]|nr:hypothetical protein [Paraburkholderia sp. USG1]